tara:strand:+ start:1826 stop:1987 length:162 start_codon:yes stop_codon:yes gene_type:complete
MTNKKLDNSVFNGSFGANKGWIEPFDPDRPVGSCEMIVCYGILLLMVYAFIYG